MAVLLLLFGRDIIQLRGRSERQSWCAPAPASAEFLRTMIPKGSHLELFARHVLEPFRDA